jgi:hypothetical protein
MNAGVFASPKGAERVFLRASLLLVVAKVIACPGHLGRPGRSPKLPDEGYIAIGADVEAVAILSFAFGANHSRGRVYHTERGGRRGA